MYSYLGVVQQQNVFLGGRSKKKRPFFKLSKFIRLISKTIGSFTAVAYYAFKSMQQP